MGVVPKSSAGWEKGVEAHSHSPDSKLRDNPFADDQPDYEAASVPPASAAFDPEAARYASFQVQQEPAPVACGCGLQFVLFLVGFIFPPTWYVGACMLPFLTDRRERGFGMANTAAAVCWTIFVVVIIAVYS